MSGLIFGALPGVKEYSMESTVEGWLRVTVPRGASDDPKVAALLDEWREHGAEIIEGPAPPNRWAGLLRWRER